MAYFSGRRPKKHSSRSEESAPDRPGDIDLLKLKNAYAELAEANREIRETTIEMMMRMAVAAEYKDADTGSHLVRIADYATEVARALGLPEDEVDLIRHASPMHDIGKIGIPDRILQKPGKLTPEEWEIMKTHPLIGGRIFGNGESKSALVTAAAQVALGHHEKYDGTGYPYGLKGNKIPLIARIVALVDVFDATLSERAYKKKWSIEDALAHIQSLSGTHLDPELVRVFVTIEPRIREIYNANVSLDGFLREIRDEELRFDGSQ